MARLVAWVAWAEWICKPKANWSAGDWSTGQSQKQRSHGKPRVSGAFFFGGDRPVAITVRP
jgi:hypothetical protein